MERIYDPGARTRFVLWHGVAVTLISLIAAMVTEDPNWYWNIPLGMAAGSAWGLLAWPVYRKLRSL
jgi:hypothetical protein